MGGTSHILILKNGRTIVTLNIYTRSRHPKYKANVLQGSNHNIAHMHTCKHANIHVHRQTYMHTGKHTCTQQFSGKEEFKTQYIHGHNRLIILHAKCISGKAWLKLAHYQVQLMNTHRISLSLSLRQAQPFVFPHARSNKTTGLILRQCI